MKKKVLIISLAALLFLLALGLTLYPLIANRYNQRHQSEIHTAYQEQVAQPAKQKLSPPEKKPLLITKLWFPECRQRMLSVMKHSPALPKTTEPF